MDVRAIFELPIPIWVMCDALDATYPTGYGALRFNVLTPRDHLLVGAPPSALGLDARPELADKELVWVQEYGAHIPESLQPATALHRIALTDVEGPTYDHKEWFTAEHQLAGCIGGWFNAVRTWAEVVTGQDLDPNHPIHDVEPVGGGLTFIEPPNDDALGLTVAISRVFPLRAEQWADILRSVRDGEEPPLEEVLSRDARAAHRRGANRRAIIDAATALEIALGRHVRAQADQLPERQRGRLNDRTSLGGYIGIAGESNLKFAVQIDRLRLLNELRNNAAHLGAAPTSRDTSNAVQVMIDFLGAHGQIRRTGEHEPDGSEWVVVDTA